MRHFGYYVARIRSKLKNDNEIICDYFIRGGAKIGNNCAIYSNLDLCEKHLLSIGDDVIISSEVIFVTHDAAYTKIGDKSKSLFGRIVIGDNCFIGERSTIMYGCELANNTIVAAGSVVTKSFSTPYTIIGGNPAKIIGTWDKYRENSLKKGMLLKETYNLEDSRFIKRKDY